MNFDAYTDLSVVTAVDLVNYRQNLLRTERLQAATINRKLQAIKKLCGWALDQGLVKANVAREVRFVRMKVLALFQFSMTWRPS